MFDGNDKHYLAMLAIPVLLSMTLGFSGDLYASTSFLNHDRTDSDLKDRDDTETREESKSHGESYLKNHDAPLYGSNNSNKRDMMQSAIESADYDAFLVAVVGTPFAEIMTQDAFTELVQRYHVQKGFYPSTYTDIM